MPWVHEQRDRPYGHTTTLCWLKTREKDCPGTRWYKQVRTEEVDEIEMDLDGTRPCKKN